VESRILVVDDDPRILELLQMRLEGEGYRVETAGDGEAALERVAASPVDLVITDLKMPGMDGLELLRRLRDRGGPPKTIFLTAHGSIGEAVRAMKLGAFDFLEKPYRGADLIEMVRRALAGGGPEHEIPPAAAPAEDLRIHGRSGAIYKVRDLIERVAPTPSSVLITGESGTGKELVARAIHRQSTRSTRAFVIIDCGALPDTLLESELFGHRKGSFTSATQDKKGLLEEADGGTVFLDEIGNISTPLQTRLLRFLENGEVRRIGDNQPRRVDVRCLAATNRDLEAATTDGSFRRDLYYRLKVVTIHLPALRERREDIPDLSRAFLAEASTQLRRPLHALTAAQEARLAALPWAGNVRELKHVIEAAVALSRGDRLDLEEVLPPAGEPEPGAQVAGLTALEQSEREQILAALRQNAWVQKRAADALKISGRVMHYKIRKYGISIPKA
jgi:DNA-binding NtrC family response regulator